MFVCCGSGNIKQIYSGQWFLPVGMRVSQTLCYLLVVLVGPVGAAADCFLCFLCSSYLFPYFAYILCPLILFLCFASFCLILHWFWKCGGAGLLEERYPKWVH